MEVLRDNIRIVIVDDHAMVRRGIGDILDHDDGIEVVGEAADGMEALKMVGQLKPDVVILDIRLPSVSGIEVTRQLKQRFPSVRVLCISSYDDEGNLAQALQAGADGFALKTILAQELQSAVKEIFHGQSFIQQTLVTPLFRGYAALVKKSRVADSGLSEVEVEVLRLIESGANNREIGDRFFWSESTCKRKLQVILDKLEARDKIQAVAIAIRRGVL